MRNFQQGRRFEGNNSRRPGGNRGSGGFGGRNGGKPQMHRATCADCGNSCEVPFKPNGTKPVYCGNCFKKEESFDSGRGSWDKPRRESFGGSRDRDFGRSSFDKEMFTATCAGCGDHCEVPFKPTGSKPVYCSICFKMDQHSQPNRKGKAHFDSRDFTGFGGNLPDERPMYVAVCEDCGAECEVPFKPTKGKPVFCENCFRKDDNKASKSKTSPAISADQLEQLNIKLDSILRRLDALTGKPKAAQQQESLKKDVSATAVKKTPEKKKITKKAVEKVEKKTAQKVEKKVAEKAAKKPVKKAAKKVTKKAATKSVKKAKKKSGKA